MDRRTFLVTTGAVAAAGAAQSGPAPAQADPLPSAGTDVRAGGHVFAADLSPLFSQPYHRDLADRFARTLATASAGRLAVAIRRTETAPSTRSRTSQADGCDAAHKTDLWFVAVDEVSDAAPAMAYFAGLPADLGISVDVYRAWLNAAGGQLLWDEAAQTLGFKPLMIGHTAAVAGGWGWSEPVMPQDFEGGAVVASGLAAAVAARLGADVRKPTAALRQEFAAGRLSYVETALPFTAAVAARYDAAGTIWFRDGLKPQGSALAVMMRRETWDGLPPADRELVIAAAARMDQQTAAEQCAHQALVAPHLRAASPMRTARFADPFASAVRAAARDAVADVAAHSATSRRVHQAYMDFRRQATGLDDPLRGGSGVS